MYNVQFESADVGKVLADFAVLGITAELLSGNTPPGNGGVIIAHYKDWRSAEKLRDYLESHHCSETPEGAIHTLQVDGWEALVATTHSIATA